MTHVEEQYNTMRTEIKAHLSTVDYVCTTADAWSDAKRDYLGVTAHTLDSFLKRHSFAIACRRLEGRHTYDVLAAALEAIHTEFNIQYKTTGTVTDNATNFCKAFNVFGEMEVINDESEDVGDDDDRNELEFQDVSEVLIADPGDGLYHLPPHQRCAAHTLNLIATKDAEDALKRSPAFAKLSRSVFAKCQGLWNKQGRANQFAELVKSKFGLYFVVPNATRWNSVFYSMERMERMINSSLDKMNSLLTSLNLLPFTTAEVNFIKDYCSIIKSFSQALNIIQGDKNVYFGYLLPTVTRLRKKLEAKAASSDLCKPLGDALCRGIEKRFGPLFDDKRALVSAAVLPCFRLDWLEDREQQQRVRSLVLEELERLDEPNQDQADVEDNEEEEDFFAKKRKVQQTPEKELERFMNDPSLEINCLHQYPLIKKVFIKYNTLFPSSASCERLFSHGKFIFRKNRHSLSDSRFEMQLLMHVNNAWK